MVIWILQKTFISSYESKFVRKGEETREGREKGEEDGGERKNTVKFLKSILLLGWYLFEVFLYFDIYYREDVLYSKLEIFKKSTVSVNKDTMKAKLQIV